MMNIRAFEHYMSIDSERYSEPSLEALNDYATRFMYTVPLKISTFKMAYLSLSTSMIYTIKLSTTIAEVLL